METTVTPRMILGMNAVSIACTIASVERVAYLPDTPATARQIGVATAMRLESFLTVAIGTDETERLILEQRQMLENCIALLDQPVGEEMDAWLKTQTR